MRNSIITLLALLSLVGNLLAKNIDEYSYIIVLDNDTAVSIPDSVFYRISRKIVFPVNEYAIPENSTFRDELLNEVMPYVNSNSYRLQSVMLRGAASPEGPYGWNKTLSHLRTNAFLNLINSGIESPLDDNLLTEEVPEDYIYLLLLMREREDKDYKRVAEIVRTYLDSDPPRVKRELMRLDKGNVWRRLIRNYFAEMRAARVVLVFKKHQVLPEVATPVGSFDLTYSMPEPLGITPVKTSVRLPRRELLSVKTNLLLDFAYMPSGYNRFCPIPNVAIEYYPKHGHFTYGASFDCPWWQDYDAHKFFQVRNYQLEARYYLQSGDVRERGYGNGPAFKGLYLQAYTHLGLYGICFDENRGWEGEGVGAGVGLGYVLPLGKRSRWRLELSAQFGAFVTKYDPYVYEYPGEPANHDNLYYYNWTLDASLFKERQYRFTWFGPTRVGITLSYDLLFRKRLRKGISLKRWESKF